MDNSGHDARVRFIAFAIITACLLGAGILVSRYANETSTGFIPKFTLTDLGSSDQLFTDSDLPAKPFLINAWASWCLPCQTEYKHLQSLADQNLIEIYGLNFKDIDKDAVRWLKYYGNVYKRNGYDPDGVVSNAFGVSVVPTSILFDSQKNIVFKHVGPLNQDIVEELLTHQKN